MKKEKLLLIPGPTMISPEVLNAMNVPAVGHRTKDFSNVVDRVSEKLKKVFQTENEVYMLTTSGSGAMEAAVANLVNDGDKVLVLVNGKFGDRFAKINNIYGADLHKIEYELGTPANPDDVAEFLEKNRDTKAVFVQQNETSTAILNDIEKIAEVVSKTDAILVVDSISGLAVADLKMDEWKVDVILAGSQKAFMLPPGLAFISFSKKAEKLLDANINKKFYFDLKAAIKSLKNSTTPYTPATALILGLDKSLDLLLEKGIKNIFKKQEKYTKMVRVALKKIGLKLLIEDEKYASKTVTAAYLPENIEWSKLNSIIGNKYNILFAGGQDELKGKIFRIGHIGYISEIDIISGIVALELALKELGYDIELGTGVKACQEILFDNKEE